jgi:hypothetical protein
MYHSLSLHNTLLHRCDSSTHPLVHRQLNTRSCCYDIVNSAGTYWRYPFRALMVAAQMSEYVVLSLEKVSTTMISYRYLLQLYQILYDMMVMVMVYIGRRG